jgi:adenosylcobinamide-GDP ribazoletransferase
MKSLLAALRFLTILPVPGAWGTAEEDLARSVPWFPLIGLLLGAAASGLAWVLSWAAPAMLAAAVLIVVLLSFSGCLHLDGLADTADGFLSSRARERILEIMKDSHVGAMGVIAIVCLVMLKFAALASLPAAALWPAVLLMPLAGRCAIVMHMALLPYARPSGLGAIFYRRPGVPGARPRWAAVWAAGVLAAVGFGVAGWWGLLVWAACLVATAAFSAYAYRKIGGATGDTFGAVCEIMEAVPAILLALGPQGGGR